MPQLLSEAGVRRIVREEQDRGVSAAQSASFKGCKLIVFAGAGFGGTHLHDVRSNLLRESMQYSPHTWF